MEPRRILSSLLPLRNQKQTTTRRDQRPDRDIEAQDGNAGGQKRKIKAGCRGRGSCRSRDAATAAAAGRSAAAALLLLLNRGRRDRERNGSEWIVCPYQIILGPGTNITRAENSSER